MTKLEKLYRSIEGLKDLGLPLNKETLDAVDQLEEELIQNEVIPRLSESIEPIISKIQRPIVLVVDYEPEEDLIVRLTRKRVITEDAVTKEFSVISRNADSENKTERTNTFATKSPKKILRVTFPNGKVIYNKTAAATLTETIETIGTAKVEALKISHLGGYLVSKDQDDFYNQYKTSDGHLVLTHSATAKKKQQLEEISKRLKLGLKVEMV